MHPSAGGRKHWLLNVEATEFAHSICFEMKSDQVKILIQWINKIGRNIKSKSEESDLTIVRKQKIATQM